MKNNKGIASVVLFLLILLLFAGGILIHKGLESVRSKSVIEESTEHAKEVKVIEIPDDWATFTNLPYRFEFEYAPEFMAPAPDSMPAPPPPSGTYLNARFSGENIPGGLPFEFCDFNVLSFKGSDWFDAELEAQMDDESYDISTLEIDGEPATKVMHKNKELTTSISYYFKHGNFAYRLGYVYLTDGEHAAFCSDSFEKSVASFTFLSEPDFIEVGNIVAGTETEVALMYEEPGNPALTVDLVFPEESICSLDHGLAPCDAATMEIGQRAELWGIKEGNKVNVIWLAYIFY